MTQAQHYFILCESNPILFSLVINHNNPGTPKRSEISYFLLYANDGSPFVVALIAVK